MKTMTIAQKIGYIFRLGIGAAIAIIAIGCSVESPDVTPDRNDFDVEPPAIPTGLSAISGDGHIALSWSATPNATKYELYRSTREDVPVDLRATIVDGSTTTYIDRGLDNGTMYRYAIAALNSAGSSGRSDAIQEEAGRSTIFIVADANIVMEGIQSISPIPEREGGPEISLATFEASLMEGGQAIDTIVYKIVAPNDHPFGISNDRLILPIDTAIDYETNPSFDLTIQGSVPDGPAGAIDIAISIQNVDDEAPVFDLDFGEIFLEEGQTSFIVGAATQGALIIASTDDVGDEIAYFFLRNNGSTTNAIGNFAIDSATGELSVAILPIYSEDDSANRRTLTLQAMDRTPGATGKLVGQIDIVITITQAPTIALSSSKGVAFSIDENDARAIDIAVISIADDELSPADTSPYSITSGHAGFAIDDGGQLTAMIDYESLDATQQAEGLPLTIRGRDSTGAIGSIDLTITVENTDDEAPTFGAIPDGILVEDGETSFVGGAVVIVANDDVGGDIAYAFLAGGSATQAADDFRIDGATGEITVANAPTYSAGDAAANRRTLAIQAMDTTSGAIGELFSQIELEIEVIPMIAIELESSEGLAFSIDESDKSGVDIATIGVKGGGTAISNYTILSGHDGFAIASDGKLTAMIDYESLDENQKTEGLSLAIRGRDSSGDIGVINLTITVDNTDDEAPIFDSPPTAATIVAGKDEFQDAAPAFMAMDDSGTEIAYHFIDTMGVTTDTFRDFRIDGATGEISVATAPTYSEIDAAANSRTLTIQATDTSPLAIGDRMTESDIVIEILSNIDSDGDGLIEISTLEGLYNIRNNLQGTSYKESLNGRGSVGGCPKFGCRGYELTRNLDFAESESYAEDSVNDDWRPDMTNPANASNPGWKPIGDSLAPFDAIFEGNGYIIFDLYTRGSGEVGLFGATAATAEIRNVGLDRGGAYGGNADGDYVGRLVGDNRGEIISSHSIGDAYGGAGANDNVGILVGRNFFNGTIISSYASGYADGGAGDNDNVGALAGLNNGTIAASYATADANDSSGEGDSVGGLAGENFSGHIVASYATGDASGDDVNDNVGGLAGENFLGDIVASYAIGNAGGSEGANDNVGALVGANRVGANSGTVSASYGFGAVMRGENVGIERSNDANFSIHSPSVITAENSSTSPQNRWNSSAWLFGDDRLYPIVKWTSGYDATSGEFSCDQAIAPAGQTCDMPIPGQYDSDGDGQDTAPAALATAPTADADIFSITIEWTEDPNATAYRVYRSANNTLSAIDYRPIAEVVGDGARVYNDADPLEGDNYYAISAINDAGEGALSPSQDASLVDIDSDADGLIDINTLEDLDYMRNNLAGTSYTISSTGPSSIKGCPDLGCHGYELKRDLNFDEASSYRAGSVNSDWRPDGGDPETADNEGWLPVGFAGNEFSAVFEGNGYTITGLYSHRREDDIGLFGRMGANAAIRNVGIDGNVYSENPAGNTGIGVLAGLNDGGTVIASYANGTANGGGGFADFVGVLIGRNERGMIVASYANGAANGGGGASDFVGALVGENNGTIAASYAIGDSNGGEHGSDRAGGLVGRNNNNGTIIASYAISNADGGAGTDDEVGALVGSNRGTIFASYGFGDVLGGDTISRDGQPPTGVTFATDLTETNVGAQWNDAARDTRDAWDFGTAAQSPALRYADYDGAGDDYDCDMFPGALPDGSALTCGTTLIPGQRE